MIESTLPFSGFSFGLADFVSSLWRFLLWVSSYRSSSSCSSSSVSDFGLKLIKFRSERSGLFKLLLSLNILSRLSFLGFSILVGNPQPSSPKISISAALIKKKRQSNPSRWRIWDLQVCFSICYSLRKVEVCYIQTFRQRLIMNWVKLLGVLTYPAGVMKFLIETEA